MANQWQPGIGALARGLLGDAIAGEPADDVLRTQELGRARLVLKLDLHAPAQQPRVYMRTNRHAHIGGDAQLVRGLQDDIGDPVR